MEQRGIPNLDLSKISLSHRQSSSRESAPTESDDDLALSSARSNINVQVVNLERAEEQMHAAFTKAQAGGKGATSAQPLSVFTKGEAKARRKSTRKEEGTMRTPRLSDRSQKSKRSSGPR